MSCLSIYLYRSGRAGFPDIVWEPIHLFSGDGNNFIRIAGKKYFIKVDRKKIYYLAGWIENISQTTFNLGIVSIVVALPRIYPEGD